MGKSAEGRGYVFTSTADECYETEDQRRAPQYD
jgi:hypothetical protein